MTQDTPEVEAPTQTLEQIASEFTAPEAAPASQSVAPVATPPPEFDSPEAAQNWQTSQIATLSSTLNTVSDELNSRKQQEFVDSQDKSIKSAIEHIRKDVAMPDDMVEGMLHVKYSRDQSFRKIFDNRAQNPDAYNRALGVIASDLKTQSQWQPEPQLAENQRALKDLQKSANRAASVEGKDAEWKGKSQGEFDQMWEKAKQGY